jgi:hypothetical protein
LSCSFDKQIQTELEFNQCIERMNSTVYTGRGGYFRVHEGVKGHNKENWRRLWQAHPHNRHPLTQRTHYMAMIKNIQGLHCTGSIMLLYLEGISY